MTVQWDAKQETFIHNCPSLGYGDSVTLSQWERNDGSIISGWHYYESDRGSGEGSAVSVKFCPCCGEKLDDPGPRPEPVTVRRRKVTISESLAGWYVEVEWLSGQVNRKRTTLVSVSPVSWVPIDTLADAAAFAQKVLDSAS